MSDFDKKMAEVFDVVPTVVDKKESLPSIPPQPIDDTNLKADLEDAYAKSKDNLQEFIDNGKEALEELFQIAKAGQHPRAFEVYSGMLKNLVDANKELLAMQKQMREMDGKKNNGGDTKIDKAIFVGSTNELNKLLKGKE
jgi:hypothetical protein